MKRALGIIILFAILFFGSACSLNPTEPDVYKITVGPLKPSNIDYAYCSRSFKTDGCGQCHYIY